MKIIRTHGGAGAMEVYENENEVRALTRAECISWLCYNDRNGCYTDSDCLAEFGEVMTLDDAHENVIEQCRDYFTSN